MEIKIKNKAGIKLLTADTLCEEDIEVTLDSSLIPSGTLNINENGTHDVEQYAQVNVEIQSGIDTSDATATSGDLLLGKTAYVNDEKIEGTIEDYDGANVENLENVSSLKKLLDVTKSTKSLFSSYKGTNLNDLINYNDTKNVEKMDYMFEYCTELITAPQFDVSSVISMTNMFYNCSKLTFVPQLNTSSLTIAQSMFMDCSGLVNAPLLLTDKVTNAISMFYGCKKLKNVPQYDFTNVTKIDRIHSGNEELEELPPLNLTNCETMNEAFRNCSKLKKVVLKTTNKFGYGQELYYTFFNCYNLNLIDLHYYYCGSSTNNSSVFYNCHSLKALVLRDARTYSVNANAFDNCYHILGTQDDTYNPKGLQDGYIYTPRDKIASFKAYTGWASIGTQFRALEDYTLDGTTTGELNYNLILKEYYVPQVSDTTLGINNVIQKTIKLNEFTTNPEVSISIEDNTIISITNVNVNTTEITFDIVGLNLGETNVTIDVSGEHYNTLEFKVTVIQYEEPTYSIETIDGVTYGFALNDNNYYESSNKKKGNSYSLCKLVFNNSNEDGVTNMTLNCINSGESNYDYGILSEIDKELTLSNSADTTNVFKSFKGLSSTEVQQVTYNNLPNGEHYIYIKYRKDSGSDSGNDSLQFKVAFEPNV